MPIKIEFGRLNRGENSPVYVKEKTSEDGSTIKRIYQRKDIDTIKNPLSRMTKALKYRLEDFCLKDEKAGKFFEFFGFKKINRQVTDNTKDFIEASKRIESDARLGNRSEQINYQKLSEVLDNTEQQDDFDITINPEKYEDSSFLADLTQDFLNPNTVFKKEIQNLDEVRAYFADCKQKIDTGTSLIKDKDSLGTYLKNCSKVRKAIETYSSKEGVNTEAAKAFLEKFDEVFPQDFGKLFDHEKMKNLITKNLNDRLCPSHNQSELAKETKKAIEDFDCIFSKSENVSKEQKYKAMKSLKTHLIPNGPALEVLDHYMTIEMKAIKAHRTQT